jgi:hypothetical protein
LQLKQKAEFTKVNEAFLMKEHNEEKTVFKNFHLVN